MTTRLSNYERLGREGKPFPKHGGSKSSAAYKAWLKGRKEA